jgi:SAM-dependent methyltransferase
MKAMEDVEARKFWHSQTTSLHRDGSDAFYRRKAEEHARFFLTDERQWPCVDLGCGAGELLQHLARRINVVAAIDYSEAMLTEAKRRLLGSTIRFHESGAFDYLPEAQEKVWMTTGAVNQYLEKTAMDAFLAMFGQHGVARTLMLFDCVDPLRYALLTFGIAYLPTKAGEGPIWRRLLRPLRMWQRRFAVAWQILAGSRNRAGIRLGKASMGYGYPPSYWREAAALLGLEITIASSEVYEYRYHVLLRKSHE